MVCNLLIQFSVSNYNLLHHITLHYPKSSAWLYFGCRDVTENMFSDETSKLVQRRVAFSRIDRDRKEYVQDLIEQDNAQIYDLISNHQAHIYICGKVCNCTLLYSKCLMELIFLFEFLWLWNKLLKLTFKHFVFH